MEMKSVNPKLRQDQIATELGCSSSNLKRYRNHRNMLSPYRIPPNSHKRRHKISKTIFDDLSNRGQVLNRPQMTSNDHK